MVRSAVVPVSSLCVDESETCATVGDRSSPRCKTESETETGSEISTAAPALTCPRACGLCNATQPTLCKFPPEMVGVWHDGANAEDADFRISTAVNRKSVDVAMTTDDAAAIKQRFYCIQWNTAPAFVKSRSRRNRFISENWFISDEFLLVSEPTAGCRRRYACARVLLKSPSLIYFRLSEQRTWPFTSLPSDPVDCSRFDDGGAARFHVLVSRDRRHAVTCHLPPTGADYRVAFGGPGEISCDATIAVVPEIRVTFELNGTIQVLIPTG